MKIMRWLTGVAAWALGRGRAKCGRDFGVNVPYDAWTRSLSEAALTHEALYRASAERDAMRGERDRWRGEAEREAGAVARVRLDGYAQAEADIAAWLRATYSGSSRIADCVGRGDHRPGDRSERCAGCGATTADERGRYVLKTTDGCCDLCVEAARRYDVL